MKSSKGLKVLSACAGLMILLTVLLSVVFSLCFDRSFYQYEYSTYGQASKIGMSDEDLMKATDTLLDYLQDERDDIVVEAEMSGHEVEVFNKRETLHMVDVKDLLSNAVTARNLLAIIGCGLLGVLIWLNKNGWATILKDAFKYGLLILGTVIAVLAVWAAFDFYDFWVDFHYLFFDNDLFFLDPNTSIMINMFPENFFSDLVFRIIAVFGIFTAAAGVVIQWIYELRRKEIIHD